MSSFIPRSVFMCVLPTVLALFTVYWLRKKKKIKSDLQNSDLSKAEEIESHSFNESSDDKSILATNAKNISECNVKNPVASFIPNDKSLQASDSSCMKGSLSEDCNINHGLSSLLSNNVEDNKYYANNVSLNTSQLENETDEQVPNSLNLSVITKSQLDTDKSEIASDSNNLSLLPDASDSLSPDSEVKSEDSESGIVDVSRTNFVSDESESIVYTEESFYDGLTSPEVEVQLKKLVAHELNMNIPTIDSNEETSDGSEIHIEQESVFITEHISELSVAEVRSDNNSLLITPIIEIVESNDENSLITNHLSDSESSSKVNNSLQSSNNDATEADELFSNSNNQVCSEEKEISLAKCDNTQIVDSCVSLPNTTLTSQENGVYAPESEILHKSYLNDNEESLNVEYNTTSEIENIDNTDSTLPNSISSESTTTASYVSEECEKDFQFKEMDINEHFNMNSNDINLTSWNTSDVQHLSVLNSNKIRESLMDLKVDNPNGHYVYEFDLAQELCGRLIGRQGKTVKSIKERSNANVVIKRHPYDPELKVVVVEGNRSDVDNALDMIRRKYPPSQFPTVSLEQTNVISSLGVSLPENLPLHLPDGASCDVILSSLVTAGHFFLQQPTHPTYTSLSTLDQCMISCYSQLNTPLLPQPVEAGVICAAPVLRGWYRAQIVYVTENGSECGIKFVDYGGFSKVLTSSLRQIRSDFMTFPFQATECYLANVRPINRDIGWTAEARALFEELAQGQILQAVPVDYRQDGYPYVHLYRVQGISNVFINRELVEQGHAVWVDNHWDPH